MSEDLRKMALLLKIVEMLSRYHKIQHQSYIMAQWKRWLITPN